MDARPRRPPDSPPNSTKPSCRIDLSSFNDLGMNYLQSLSFCLLFCMPGITLLNSRKPSRDGGRGRGFSGPGGGSEPSGAGQRTAISFGGRQGAGGPRVTGLCVTLTFPAESTVQPSPDPRSHSHHHGSRVHCSSGHLLADLGAPNSPSARSPHTHT